MRDMHKKILSIALATACTLSIGSFASCGKDHYKGDTLANYQSTDSKAESNGGFAVKKDGFVYFINGMQDASAERKSSFYFGKGFGDGIKR